MSFNIKRLGATSVAQLGVAALDKGWVIAGKPRLDLSHACGPECVNTYGLVCNYTREAQVAYVKGCKNSKNSVFNKVLTRGEQ
jgi:hypothetical protein